MPGKQGKQKNYSDIFQFHDKLLITQKVIRLKEFQDHLVQNDETFLVLPRIGLTFESTEIAYRDQRSFSIFPSV